MTAELRPMSLGEILDRTFQIYRQKFLLFVSIAALPALLLVSLQIFNVYWWNLRVPYSPLRFLAFGISDLAFLLAVYHISLFLHVLSWACCAEAASKAYLGEAASSMGALKACGRRWRGWLGLTSRFWLQALVVPEIGGILLWTGTTALLSEGIKLDGDTMESLIEPITVALTALTWAASLWIGAVLSCGIPIWTVEEGSTIRAAFRRARKLSRKSRWRIMFSRAAVACVGWMLATALTSTVLFVLYFSLGHDTHFWFRYGSAVAAVRLISAAGIAILVGPIFPIALTLFYYDQRIRHEGFDIEWMMNQAGMNAPLAIEPAVEPVAAAESGEQPA
jgi:hypothetical protein